MSSAVHAAVSGLIPGRLEIFNKRFLPGTRRGGRTDTQSLVSVPNSLGLNPKSLRSACDM